MSGFIRLKAIILRIPVLRMLLAKQFEHQGEPVHILQT